MAYTIANIKGFAKFIAKDSLTIRAANILVKQHGEDAPTVPGPISVT